MRANARRPRHSAERCRNLSMEILRLKPWTTFASARKGGRNPHSREPDAGIVSGNVPGRDPFVAFVLLVPPSARPDERDTEGTTGHRFCRKRSKGNQCNDGWRTWVGTLRRNNCSGCHILPHSSISPHARRNETTRWCGPAGRFWISFLCLPSAQP